MARLPVEATLLLLLPLCIRIIQIIQGLAECLPLLAKWFKAVEFNDGCAFVCGKGFPCAIWEGSFEGFPDRSGLVRFQIAVANCVYW